MLCNTAPHDLLPHVKRCHTKGYSIFCEAFLDPTASPPCSQAVGKKIFFGDTFLADLYHPRALSSVAEIPSPFLGLPVPPWQPILSSSGGRPCTTGDAWPYRDLFSGISDWLFAWLAVEIEPAQIQSPTPCTVRCRRLAWDDWA